MLSSDVQTVLPTEMQTRASRCQLAGPVCQSPLPPSPATCRLAHSGWMWAGAGAGAAGETPGRPGRWPRQLIVSGHALQPPTAREQWREERGVEGRGSGAAMLQIHDTSQHGDTVHAPTTLRYSAVGGGGTHAGGRHLTSLPPPQTRHGLSGFTYRGVCGLEGRRQHVREELDEDGQQQLHERDDYED